jgi:hypothetical protein
MYSGAMSSNDQVDSALSALKDQYTVLTCELEEVRAQLADVEWKRDNLAEAIAALERMVSPVMAGQTEVDRESQPQRRDEDDVLITIDGARVQAFSVADFGQLSAEHDESQGSSIHPAIAPYVARGGAGKRLRSPAMVADLLNSTDESFTREELKKMFFDRYPRAVLEEKYWERPDKAFGNALIRAVEEGLISKGRRNGATEVFISRAACDKVSGNRPEPEIVEHQAPHEEDD